MISIDSRPSDALAIALRLDCPIYVEETVLKTSKTAPSVAEVGNNEELRRWLVWLGTRSYAIYLFHQAISGIFHGTLAENPPAIHNGRDALVTLSALAATLLVAEASWRFVESRFIALGRRRRYAVEPAEGLAMPIP